MPPPRNQILATPLILSTDLGSLPVEAIRGEELDASEGVGGGGLPDRFPASATPARRSAASILFAVDHPIRPLLERFPGCIGFIPEESEFWWMDEDQTINSHWPP